MTSTVALTNLGNIANAMFNSITANSTAITALSVGGASINATAFPGTANNASNLGGTAAASYQLNSTLAANVATMSANNANNLGGAAASSYVNTSGAYTLGGNITLNANLTIAATGELIIANGAGIQANGTFGTAGQSLTSNGTGVYWGAGGVNTATTFAWTNTHTFAANVTFDTSTLFVDATNDRVGIGTASPSASLHVNGNFIARNANYTFTMPNVGGAGSWIRLGTFTATQAGQHVHIKVVTSVGYNADPLQQSEIHIHFKTSNGSSVNANGFAGDVTFYVTNANGSAYNVKVVGNAAGGSATSYDIFFFQAGAFNGDGSFYTVELGQATSTWTNIGTTASDPGVASSTVAIGSNRFLVQSNVGIGNSAPTVRLQVQGAILASDNITAYSDEKLKKDVITIEGALDKVKQIRGVRYTQIASNNVGIGVIAQEVQPYVPEVVAQNGEYLSVAYGNMVGLLIEAIKEQQKQIEALQQQVQSLAK